MAALCFISAILLNLYSPASPVSNNNAVIGSGTVDSCLRRAVDYEVVDSILARRRRCAIEHNPERRLRVVVQPENARQRKHQRQRSKRGQRYIRRSKIDKPDSIETVLKLITVEPGAGSLRRKTHDDI